MQINQQALVSLRRRCAMEIIFSLISGVVFDVLYAYVILTLPTNVQTFWQLLIYLFPLAVFFILDNVVSGYVFIKGHFRLRAVNRAHLLVAAVNGKAGAGPKEISKSLNISPKRLKKQLRFLIYEAVVDNAYWNKKNGNFTSVPTIPAFYNAEKCEDAIRCGRRKLQIGAFLAEISFTCFYFAWAMNYYLSNLGMAIFGVVFFVGVWILLAGKKKMKAAKTARIDALCLVGDPTRNPATIAAKQKISERKAAKRLKKNIENGFFHTIRKLPSQPAAKTC